MKHGDITKIAIKAGCSTSALSDIINRRRTPSRRLAARLEKETGINRLAWLYPDEHPNPMLHPLKNADNG